MTVPMNNDLDIGKLGAKPLFQSLGRASFRWMVDTYLEVLRLYNVNRRQFLSDVWPVDVAVDAFEGADLTQGVHEWFACEVPGVDDQISTRQLVEDVPRQVLNRVRVSIRDDAYLHNNPLY